MKDFIIIGNMNAIAYKEIFPLIKENKIWLGVNSNKTMEFRIPAGYEKWKRIENGQKIGKVPGVSWYTNISNETRNTPLDLYKRYSDEYHKYDNYDAIEVSKTCYIPMDYDGIMGVPISFLSKYCPTQFEIIGNFNRYKEPDEANGLLCGTPTEYIDKNGEAKIWTGPTVNKKTCYSRLLIRRRR